MENTNELLFERLKVLAECYSSGIFDSLFPLLSDDVSLTSMWVLETLSGLEKVKEYYIGKGETVRKHGAFPICRIVRSVGNHPHGELLIHMYQYLPNETADGIIDIGLNEEGKINKISLCDKIFYPFEPLGEKSESEEWAEWFQDQSAKIRARPWDHFLVQEMRRRRKEIFLQTMELVESGEYTSENGKDIIIPDPEPMTASTVFYQDELPQIKEQKCNSLSISVENEDCLLAGKLLKEKGYFPAVLNMASRRNPGGGVINGAGAQEENLFRRSNLFKSMYQFADFSWQYGIRRSKYQYPLNHHFGGVYTPDAFFFRGEEKQGYPLLDEPYSLSVISVPAINLKGHELTGYDYSTTMKNKIRTILRIGYEHGHDALVLSAFGCGAFGNDPETVAKLFLEVFSESEFEKSFRKIVFAIIEDHNSKGNYSAFKKIIG